MMKKSEAAKIINHEWKYSWHWDEYFWESQALKDARARIADVKRELELLEQCAQILKGQIMTQRVKSIKDAHGDYLEIQESWGDVFIDITSKDMQNETLNTVRFKKENLRQIIEFLQELESPTDGAQ